MTTKTAGKVPKEQPVHGPSQQELHAAHQVHTLAQILYGQLAATHPWIQPTYPMGMEPRMPHANAPWAQTPWTTPMWGQMPQTYFGQPCQGTWCNPMAQAPTGYPFMGPMQYFGSDVFPR
jgi:hypothetical protein